MSDYEYIAEKVFNEVRLPGSTFWLELSAGERQRWTYIVRAAELHLPEPEPDEYWCPDCEGYRDELLALEGDIEDANDRIEELEEELRQIREAA